MGDPDKIKQLYSTVSKDYDVGTYDDFSAKLQDSAKRKSFYEFASKNYDLGDYASFEGKVVKKKVGTSVSPAGSSGTTQPISAQKEADIRSYLSATPEQKNANAKGTVITDKPITAVKEKHLPSPKEVETEAVRRLTSPLATMQKIKKQDQIPGMNMGDDFLGDELGKLEKEKNNIVSGKITDPQSVGDRTVNEEIAIKEKQGQILKDNAFQTGKDAGNYLQYLENKNQKENSVDLNQLPVEEVAKRLPNTITAKSAFSKYQDRRKVTDALSGTENLIDAAFNYAGVKDLKNVSDAKKGYLVDQFLNNKDVQELVQENPQLYGKYKEAQINAMTQFPSYAMKSINQKVGQYIQDTDKDVWDSLGKNIKDEKLSEVVDEMVAKGELNEMEKSFFIKNKENAKSWLEYADPKIDQSLNRSAGEGWRGWEKSVRSIGNKLGLTDAGLLEPIENTDKRMEEIEYSTPNIQPKGTFGKAKKGISEFTGQMLPMMLTAGLMRGAGSGATAAEVFPVIMQFGGENERKAREHFKDDKLSQIQYTIAQTSIDAMLGRLLPHGKIANNLRTELRKDVVTAIEQLSAGNIEKAAVKENLIGAIGDKLKDIAKHNVKTANIVTGFQIAHNGIDAAFGKRDFKLEDEARDAFDTWKHSFVSATALSALASKTGYAQRGRDRQAAKDFIYDLAKNPEQAAAKIKEQAELNPEAVKDVEKRIENVQYGAKVLEELGRETEMNEQQKKNYLLNSLNEKVLREKAEATVDPTLKKKLDEQVKKAEIIKEEIINGKDVESLPQDDGLSAKEYKEVAEIKNDQELFDYFVKKSTKGYASTLNAALEMENKDEGRREGLKYMEDKAIENPKKFREDFGDALTEKMLDRVETKRLEESLDNLLDINADDPSIPILDKLIEKRYEKEGRKEEEVEVQEETIEPKESSISVIKPGEIKQPTETIIIKPKEDAISIGKSKEASLGETPGDSKTMGERIPKSKESTGKEEGGKSSGEEKIGITHRQMDEVAKELGMPTYEKDPETVAEWDAEAAKRIASNENTIPDLLNKMREGVQPDKIEQRIMVQYIADLKAKINKNPTDALLAQMKRAKDLSNIVGGREVAKSLVARKGERDVVETISDALVDKMDRLGVERLTEKQKEETAKLFKEDQEVTKAYEEKIAKLEEENAKLRSEAEVKKMAASRPKTKKTHEEYAQERKDAVKAAREALLKVAKGGGGAMSSIPGAAQLAAIAPHVKKIVESYVAEGIDKLSEVVRKVHEDFKDLGVTEKDIHNIIAGVYNEKKATQRDLAIRMRDLQTEAKLINRLEELEAGIEPKSEKKKRQQNKEIADLKKQIDEHDLSKLAERKTRIQEQIKKVEEQIKNRDFAPEQKKTELKLDKEALELEDKLIEVRNRREYEKLKDIYANQSNWEKGVRYTSNILNVPRSLMSSMDFSAMLRQGIIPSISHPAMASRAAKEMFRSAFSQKNYDRWFFDLQKSPRFKEMNENGLALTDSTDPHLQAREELFMSNLAEKIPVAGSLVKGSERAYSMFLNKIRVDLYNRFADAMEKNGKTVQNSPEQYKEMAKYVNNSTGRGSVAKSIEPVIPLMNSLFFSPRLIASRINMLTYLSQRRFYKTVPAEVRKAYFKDMASFIGIGLTVLALAKLNGADVEDDPRSSDFGKIKSGNTRWDIWGGFQPYVRAFEQVRTGQRKSTTTGKIYELDGKGMFGQNRGDVLKNFFRGKLAPVPSMAVDMLSRRTMVGDRIVYDWEGGQKEKGIKDILKEHLLPMTITGMEEALKDQGTKAWFTVGIPSLFGIGTQSYESNKKK